MVGLRVVSDTFIYLIWNLGLIYVEYFNNTNLSNIIIITLVYIVIFVNIIIFAITIIYFALHYERHKKYFQAITVKSLGHNSGYVRSLACSAPGPISGQRGHCALTALYLNKYAVKAIKLNHANHCLTLDGPFIEQYDYCVNTLRCGYVGIWPYIYRWRKIIKFWAC